MGCDAPTMIPVIDSPPPIQDQAVITDWEHDTGKEQCKPYKGYKGSFITYDDLNYHDDYTVTVIEFNCNDGGSVYALYEDVVNEHFKGAINEL